MDQVLFEYGWIHQSPSLVQYCTFNVIGNETNSNLFGDVKKIKLKISLRTNYVECSLVGKSLCCKLKSWKFRTRCVLNYESKIFFESEYWWECCDVIVIPESGGDDSKHDQESNILGQWPTVTAGTFLNEIFLTSGQGSRQTAREKWNLLWTWPWVGSRHRTSVFINKFSLYDNLWSMMLVPDPPATVEQPGVQVLVSHHKSYEWSDI